MSFLGAAVLVALMVTAASHGGPTAEARQPAREPSSALASAASIGEKIMQPT